MHLYQGETDQNFPATRVIGTQSVWSPFHDSLLQFGNVVEDASAYLLASDLGEEALNQIEPGRRCRDEVQLEARMALQPALYSRRLVRGVGVGDQAQVEIGEGFSVDLLQKLEEFPGAMARHAFA